jgi:hypothetical protein
MNRFSKRLLFAPILICTILFCQTCIASDSSFSSSDWKSALHHLEHGHTDRSDEFRKFLQNYDLIGMPRSQLAALLGDVDHASGYTIRSGSDSIDFLEVQYENEKVDRWRICGFPSGRDNPWQRTNMLYTSNGLIAKRK